MKKVLIVEDEKSISNYIKDCVKSCYPTAKTVQIYTIDEAFNFIEREQIDILLLDLNLNNEDGFQILQKFNSNEFYTIIISAYKEKAIEAFEHGVVDFIPKPFREERLQKAFNRCSENRNSSKTKYLTVKHGSNYSILELKDVYYFEAADVYTKAICKNESSELLSYSMKKLEIILPDNFIRIHRSYIIRMSDIRSYSYVDGGKYVLTLLDNTELPLSRRIYKKLKSETN